MKQVLETAPDEQSRLEFAQKIGFQAYAATPDLPDPVVEALRVLLDHMQATDRRIDVIANSLCKLNPSFCDPKSDPLSPEALAIIEDLQRDCPKKAQGK